MIGSNEQGYRRNRTQTLSDNNKNQALANLGIKIKANGTLYIEQ